MCQSNSLGSAGASAECLELVLFVRSRKPALRLGCLICQLCISSCAAQAAAAHPEQVQVHLLVSSLAQQSEPALPNGHSEHSEAAGSSVPAEAYGQQQPNGHSSSSKVNMLPACMSMALQPARSYK